MPLSNYLPSSRVLTPGVCTSTTRPASPYEGQAIYETDTDMMAIWNGSAWRYIASTTAASGSVLQTVEGSYATTTSTTSLTFVDTNLSATITPKSSSSKILVIANQAGCGKYGGNGSIVLELLRGATQLSVHYGGYDNTTGYNFVGSICINYLDSPATTSATTYKTRFRSEVSGQTTNVNDANSRSSIILMEIAG
jgi:hypothetical protein